MAETRFIKTVAFGGYDKNDVEKKLEFLYSQLHDLRIELRDSKLALDKYKKGTEEEKIHEALLSAEKARLTEVQVQNETMSDKIKSLEDENENKNSEIEILKNQNLELEKTISNLKKELLGYKAENEAAALSGVFIAAQDSANMLEENARKKAGEIEADAKKLTENMVTEANNKAAQIIYDAEKQAAEIHADALNKAEEMKVASNNMKAVMVKDISKIGDEIAKVKLAMEKFAETGYSLLDDSETLLRETENELKNDGVPVFKNPETYAPEYPESPELQPVDSNYRTANPVQEKKKNAELEKLQAMAAALNSEMSDDTPESTNEENSAEQDEQTDKPESSDDKNENNSQKGGIDLAELAKQAAELNN